MESPVVMCAVGAGDRSRDAVAAAGRLAGGLGARLLLVHVFDPMDVGVPATNELTARRRSTEDYVQAARVEAHGLLAAAARELEGREHDVELREGPVVPALLDCAREHAASLLVTSTSAPASIDWFLTGSVAADLAARAPCPVLVVGPGASAVEAGPVLCGYDGSAHSLRAAEHAARLARALRQELLLVHVRSAGDERPAVDDAAASLGGDVTVRPLVVEGDAATELARLARTHAASIIVAGTRGRGPLTSALLGSVSADLVRSSGRAVLLVPATAAG